VLVLFVTVAVNVCELPSKTEPVVGVTVMPMDGGGGGGGGGGATDRELPPPHPSSHAHAGRSSKTSSARMVSWANVEMRPLVSVLICERGGRMRVGMQAKGQRKERTSSTLGDKTCLRRASITY